eukprot:TRINITY_DN7612_c0_g1_i1.p1 TRINITY_DN7612_c0_g1~~TRINITY_DN7612_c0_g1_i1.p1  ORF type:complete len:118 (+),score=28.26 TRINITY_DN7612_c0_g1_i1:103-456(+)
MSNGVVEKWVAYDKLVCEVRKTWPYTWKNVMSCIQKEKRGEVISHLMEEYDTEIQKSALEIWNSIPTWEENGTISKKGSTNQSFVGSFNAILLIAALLVLMLMVGRQGALFASQIPK